MQAWNSMTGANPLLNNAAAASCTGGGNTAAEITNTFLSLGMGIAAMALSNQQASSVQGADKQVSKAAKAVIANYAADSATAINNFNTKYAQFGTVINSEGKVTKSYDDISNELQTKKNDLQKLVGDNKNENLELYNKTQGEIIACQSAIDTFTTLESQLSNMASGGKINITGDSATAVTPSTDEFEIYLSAEDKKAGKKPEETQAYQDELSSRQELAKTYNDLKASQNKVLTDNGVTGKEGLDQKKSDLEGKLADYGKATLTGDTSVASYVNSLKDIDSQISKLGSKADFDNAVKTVTDLHTAYTNALSVQTSETRLTEANNAVKNTKAGMNELKRGGHKGLRGFAYDIFHKDSKNPEIAEKRTVYNNAKEARDKQQVAMHEKYAEFYPKTDA